MVIGFFEGGADAGSFHCGVDGGVTAHHDPRAW
jgi:hypothetical protein